MGNDRQRRLRGHSRLDGVYGRKGGATPGKRPRTLQRYAGVQLKPAGNGKDEREVCGEDLPLAANADDFIRESVMPTLSIEIPELEAQANLLVRNVTPWPIFKAMVIGSHEWDDPIRRAVFVRYFSQSQRRYWNEGQEANMADVLSDVVSVELELWQERTDVGSEPRSENEEADVNHPSLDSPADPDFDNDQGNESANGHRDAASDGLQAPQATGSGLVVFYDSMQRLSYAKTIKRTAIQAMIEIGTAHELEGDARKRLIAQRTSLQRNWERKRTQGKVTPGARMMSELLEGDRSWEWLVNKYGDDPEAIVRASGRTNRSILRLAKVGAVAGPLAAGVSTFMSGDAIVSAPPGERSKVASEEIGGTAGGTIGSVLGGAAATAAVGLLLGSNPAGWVVVGASIVGSALGGIAGSEAGRGFGRNVYEGVQNVGNALEFMGDYIADEIHDSSRQDTCASEFAPPDLCAGVDSNYAFKKRLGYDPEHDDD